ncbi:MAG: Hsp20/alpha crystallin family protein [Anaerolineales bacterium]|nr:MAG: Hsp20/alpha crystallin family protein [Anaerolineales bacterium]
MSLIRRDPFREMMSLRSMMDRLFDDAFFRTRWDWEPESGQLSLDVSESEGEYTVKASIPGINPNDLDITFTGKTLTIKGEYKEEETKEGVQYHVRERRYGSFSRSVTLPTTVESDNIEARYEAGVLTLRLPKTEEVKPKRISVRSIEAPQMIEGRAKDIASKN